MKRNSFLKSLLVASPFLYMIFSCQGGVDILAGRYVSAIYDPWGTPVTRAPAPTVYIACPTGGSGCRSIVDQFGLYYDQVTVVLRHMDTIYSYYYANNLSGLYAAHGEELRDGFPGIENERPGAIDSLLDGRYSIKVLLDSSIVIVNHNKDSISVGDIIFALDKEGQPKN